MRSIRLIGRLDVKGDKLIKGIQLEGLRVVGNPNQFAKSYYEQGIDELLYIDSVASLYGRNNLSEIVQKTTNEIFIPVTVGGGIRNLEDINTLLRSGADKIAINTAAIKNPNLIKDAVLTFGSQSIVISIVAKKISNENWEAYIEGGRERTGINAIDWAKKAEALGVGEMLVTSVDKDGTRSGYDIDLISKISKSCNIPLIASGGAGDTDHLLEAYNRCDIDGLAIGSILHFQNITIDEIKNEFTKHGLFLRPN